jgi:hypothetical protein
MDGKAIEYLVYLPASVLLTVWVARTLFHHGKRFLLDVFRGDEGLADSVNHLLVVGFYLINLGYVSLQLRLDTTPQTAAEVVEALGTKVGLVLVVLGVMHFLNLGAFSTWRRQATRPAPPPRTTPPAPTQPQ